MSRLWPWRRGARPGASPSLSPVSPDVPVDLALMTSYRAEDFPAAGPHPWLDSPDAELEIKRLEATGKLSAGEAEICRKWARDGYVIVDGIFDDDRLDFVWSQYEHSIDTGVINPPDEPHFPGDTVPGRALNPHFHVEAIKEMMSDPKLVHVVELLMGARSIAFQSISGHKASQQDVHSDSVHMTTYPTGYLVAMWIAFEDISRGAGPLVYYPGSHKLPTIYSRDVGIALPENREPNYADFTRLYTPAIYKEIEDLELEPNYFTARKGQILFWHANLLHGGSKRDDMSVSRKALVFHFFAQGCVCYHDLSGSLSWLHSENRPVA